MKALKILLDERKQQLDIFEQNKELGNPNENKYIVILNEAIEELEFYLSKRNSYPPCDACGKEVDYMPWHYSTEKERHLHSCDECWESIKDKFTLKG